jgi:tRNA(fMet)-specific endonuclease VapC
LDQAVRGGESIGVSAIVLYELWYGVAKSARPKENAERLRIFLSSGFSVLPFEEEDAELAGDIRAKLEALGKPIGPYDLLIAAQAVRRGTTLVTANMTEFRRVPGLKVSDWAKAR